VLILQYFSNEKLDAVQKEAGWLAVDHNANPEALWQLVEMKHKVHSVRRNWQPQGRVLSSP
jgi:hypothetical protein